METNPKEKAKELYRKFGAGGWGREHALSCVDEIMKASTIKQSPNDPCKFIYTDEYWKEVRKELLEF